MADPIELLIQGRAHELGPGFAVRRVLPSAKRRMVGPFIFLDHFGPMSVPPGGDGMDGAPAPAYRARHRHLPVRRRHLPSRQPGLRPGDPAGRRQLDDRPAAASPTASAPRSDEASGFRMHGVQTWVALPKSHEETAPSFQHVPAGDLPAWQEAGASLRLIVGSYAGRQAPTTHFSPIFYVAAELPAASKLAILAEYAERGVYVSEGTVTIGDRQLGVGDLAVLTAGSPVEALAGAEGAKLMLLGGAPMDGRATSGGTSCRRRRNASRRPRRTGRTAASPRCPGDPEFIPLPDR
jgi:Pirin-related protein